MPRTYETASPTDSQSNERIREERSGVILQFRSTPAALQRLSEHCHENTNYERERDHLRSEMGFQKHRHFAAAKAMDRIHALELQAIEEFSIDRILSAVNKEENQELYEEICRIENSYINQLINLDYEPNVDFENQRGISLINLIKFFLSKVELCYQRGVILNKNNLDDHILTDTELRLNDIRKQIRQLFNEAREIGRSDPERFRVFKDDVAALTTDTTASSQMPDKAPELYKNRTKREIDGILRKEKPDEFIRRVYEPWLLQPGGLPRPVIRDLDEACYRALYKHGIPDDFETLLPTAQGRAVEHLTRTPEDRVAALNEAQRRANAKRRKRQLSS